MVQNSDTAHASAARPPRALARLADLISPLDLESFELDHWERRRLLLRRDDPDRYRDLLTLDDVDRILSVGGPHLPELMVVTDGARKPAAALIEPSGGDGGRGLEPLYDRYRHGATIVLMFLHERWAPLGRLCADLAAELAATVSANAYLTPAGAQGFSAHYDTHDVFVAQIHGSKHWRLYDSPTELPLREQASVRPAEGYGKPVEEFDLRTGDLLYLPRGTVHDAVSNDEASLHLTIGVAPLLWMGALHELVDRAAEQHRELRASLPLGFATDPERQAQARSRLAATASSLVSEISAHAVIGAAVRRAAGESPPVLADHLSELEAIRSARPDTRVRRRDGLRAVLSIEGSHAALEFAGKVVRLPARLADELHFATTAAPEFTARDLPGPLDDAGRMVLIRRLVQEGFLTLA